MCFPPGRHRATAAGLRAAVRIAALLSGLGCAAGPAPVGLGQARSEEGLARVERVAVTNNPVQSPLARVRVSGTLPDACTHLGELRTRRTADGFELTLVTRREQGVMCAQVVTPFERSYTLGIADLQPGAYGLSVNGVKARFEVVSQPADGGRFTRDVFDDGLLP